MLNLTYKDKVDSLEYYNNISVDKVVYFNLQKVLNTIEIERAMAVTNRDLAIDALHANSDGSMFDIGELAKFGGSQTSKDRIIDYLYDEVGEGRGYLIEDYSTKQPSLNVENILIPLLEKGYAEEFLDYYISYRKHNTAANNMTKKVNSSFVKSEIPGISLVRYQWNKALTGRYYTENENIQNINKLYLDCMCGQNNDYLLVWGDFDQIDLRVAYYTVISESKEDDMIFEQYEDKYEAMARIIDRKLGRQFNVNQFKSNRKKYKKGILARCYGQTLNRLKGTVGDKDFAVMLDKYFLENERYNKWYNRIEDLVSYSSSIDIYTYFGNICHVNFESGLSKEKKLDRVLNCPIQGTSNDIVMHVVNKTVREFREAGVSEDKFRVYMVRHDEPIYMIHKDALQHLPIIRNNTILQIDNWGPITMSMDIGKYYTVSEIDTYRKLFGNNDIELGRVVVPRLEKYDPLIKQDNSVLINIEVGEDSLKIDDEIHLLDFTMHKQYQIHKLLAKYAIENNTATITYNILESDIKLYDAFVDGVYIYFNSNGEAS